MRQGLEVRPSVIGNPSIINGHLFGAPYLGALDEIQLQQGLCCPVKIINDAAMRRLAATRAPHAVLDLDGLGQR